MVEHLTWQVVLQSLLITLAVWVRFFFLCVLLSLLISSVGPYFFLAVRLRPFPPLSASDFFFLFIICLDGDNGGQMG